VTTASLADRAGVYHLLASSFLDAPTPERIAQLRDPAPIAQLGDASGAPPDDAGAVHQEFMDLFKVPLGRYIPPYESVHRDARLVDGKPTRGLLMGPSTVDVRRLYQDAGAALQLAELPDHIGVELAFLSFLCQQERAARANGDHAAADNYRAYQRGFLAGHVLEWVPGYCELVQEQSTTHHFRVLTTITPRFCRLDLAGLDASS
jgi:putative dimethyl sulfoxide reductase chaperone